MADKETRELLSWGLDTALDAKQIYANHKLGLEDIGPVIHIVKGAPAAIGGMEKIPGEFMTYSEDEQAELTAIVADKLGDFGLNVDEVKEASELILDAAIADAKVAQFFAKHKKPGE